VTVPGWSASACSQAVVVIGGGDTAMDCVRTIREGGAERDLLYGATRQYAGEQQGVPQRRRGGGDLLFQAARSAGPR